MLENAGNTGNLPQIHMKLELSIFFRRNHGSFTRYGVMHHNSGSVYMGPDLFGIGTILVRESLVFTRDLMDPVRIRSAIRYQMGPLMKVIPYGTVPFQSRTDPV